MMSEQELTPAAKAVAEQWGEAFGPLAMDPRLEFDGDVIRVTLWRAITNSGQTVTQLEFREPTLEQLQQLDKTQGDMARTKRLLMQVCGLSDKEAGTIGLRDLGQASRLLNAFTEAARGTGA